MNRHPDPLIGGYLQVALNRFKTVKNPTTAMCLLELAAKDVNAHLRGEANMKSVFETVIKRHQSKP
ncbi:hypothetical protein [Runella zeae]|uniref:hypothetical protein n=1 Tax=Runella zeae TaxID=94255 RepID=UPI00041D5AE7|nr:hypothetical protein [Runella zeae]